MHLMNPNKLRSQGNEVNQIKFFRAKVNADVVALHTGGERN